MADTPSIPLPLNPDEQPILESLQQIRDELTLLKQDRTTYVKTKDVMQLNDRLVEQVQLLNDVRAEPPEKENRCQSSQSVTLQINSNILRFTVDRVLDGCFQLISLFFMTVGRNNDAPAAYALTSTIKRLLDHLIEVDLYSAKDLDHVSGTIQNIRQNVRNSEASYSPNLLNLLSNRLDVCQSLLTTLLLRLGRLQGGLPAIHEKLISILRSISLANTRSKVCVVYARGGGCVTMGPGAYSLNSSQVQKYRSFRISLRR